MNNDVSTKKIKIFANKSAAICITGLIKIKLSAKLEDQEIEADFKL